MRSRGKNIIVCGIFIPTLILSGACAVAPGTSWGEEAPAGRAVPLSVALESSPPSPADVVVRGRIGEVCRESGCWFVLQEVTGDRLHQVLVDLDPSAGFTVPPGAAGRMARVSGRLVGQPVDRRLVARGLVLES